MSTHDNPGMVAMESEGRDVGSEPWFAAWKQEELERLEADRPAPGEVPRWVRTIGVKHKSHTEGEQTFDCYSLDPKSREEKEGLEHYRKIERRQASASWCRFEYARTHGESCRDVDNSGTRLGLVYGRSDSRSTARAIAHAAACWVPAIAVTVVAATQFQFITALMIGLAALAIVGLVLLKHNLVVGAAVSAVVVCGYRFGPTHLGSFPRQPTHYVGALTFLLPLAIFIPRDIQFGTRKPTTYIARTSRRRRLARLIRGGRRSIPETKYPHSRRGETLRARGKRWSRRSAVVVAVIAALAVAVAIFIHFAVDHTKHPSPTPTPASTGNVVEVVLVFLMFVVASLIVLRPTAAGIVTIFWRVVDGCIESASPIAPIPLWGKRVSRLYSVPAHIVDARRAVYPLPETGCVRRESVV